MFLNKTERFKKLITSFKNRCDIQDSAFLTAEHKEGFLIQRSDAVKQGIRELGCLNRHRRGYDRGRQERQPKSQLEGVESSCDRLGDRTVGEHQYGIGGQYGKGEYAFDQGSREFCGLDGS